MSIKITPMPTLRSLSTEIQLLVQSSTHISSDLGALLRTTQQIIAAHNDLKTRIKIVSEGLEGVARVEEGIVSVDKGVFEAERDGDTMAFVKTPPTTPPTLVNSSVDPGQKIWRPNSILQEKESTKNGSNRREKGGSSAGSSKQSSHASSPITQIDSVVKATNGYEKESSSPSQHNTPYLPGAYVFSEVSSPVRDESEPFLGLGSGRDEELDINAVLAQLAEKEREHIMEETEMEKKRSSRQNSSRTSSKKSTPSYRRSPNMPMEKIPEHQQAVQEVEEIQGQNHIWKGFNASSSNDAAELVDGNRKINGNYAINLIPNADEFIEYVDSPRDSPPTFNGNVNDSKRSNSQTDIKPISKASVSASASASASIPAIPDVKNGKTTNGAYSFVYPNNGSGNGHLGNGKTLNGNGNDFATIRVKSTNNNNNPVIPRPNPFSSLNTSSTSVAPPTTVHPPAAPTAAPSVSRSTQVPLRSKSPSPPVSISKATNGNGKSNGHSSYQKQQTNAAIGATIARPMSAMSNASASSSVMSPPYEVFHPPRQTDSDSDSDSDSQDSDREFFEKMLERASDTEGMKPKEKVDRGKGKELNVPSAVVDKGKGKEKERGVVDQSVYQEEPSTPRPTGESSKYRESTISASNGHSKPPSVKSKTSPKVSGGENIADTTGESQAVYPIIRTSPATSLASTTQDNTPVPYSTHLHPHPHSVSTFSHDMMRSPQTQTQAQAGVQQQRTSDTSETPRMGNALGGGGSGRSSAGASLSLAAVGEALQQSQSNGHGHGHAHATRNGPHSQLPPSAFASSSSSSRASTVTVSSSSSGGGGGSVPESSNASPDISPSIRDNNISVWASTVDNNGHAVNAVEGGQNLLNVDQQQPSAWNTFDRATITPRPTNFSRSNGTMNENEGDGLFLPPVSIPSAVTTASASDTYPYPPIVQQERGRGLVHHHHATTVPIVPPSPSSSVTRHLSLRRERERERDKESQRPSLRASSAKPKSTMKMASAKTTDSAKKPSDGNVEASSIHTPHSGRGHSRALSDTTTTSQTNFSSFHFNHLSSLSSSSSQNNSSTAKVPASAVLPSLSTGGGGAYKSTTSSVRPSSKFIPPSVEKSLTKLLQSQNIPFEDVGVIKRWKPPVHEEGRNGNGNGNGNGTVKRKSVYDSSPPSNPTTSSSASSSVQVQQQPSVNTNGHGKPTSFEW